MRNCCWEGNGAVCPGCSGGSLHRGPVGGGCHHRGFSLLSAESVTWAGCLQWLRHFSLAGVWQCISGVWRSVGVQASVRRAGARQCPVSRHTLGRTASTFESVRLEAGPQTSVVEGFAGASAGPGWVPYPLQPPWDLCPSTCLAKCFRSAASKRITSGKSLLTQEVT